MTMFPGFTLPDELDAFHRGLLEAMDDSQRKGIAAVTYKGDMVDEADEAW